MNKNGGPNYIQAWREHRGFTQEQLAEKLDTSASQISMLEAGERGLTARWLRRLAEALDTTAGNLLDYPPGEGAEIFDLWQHADLQERRQLSKVAEAIIGYRTG